MLAFSPINQVVPNWVFYVIVFEGRGLLVHLRMSWLIYYLCTGERVWDGWDKLAASSEEQKAQNVLRRLL